MNKLIFGLLVITLGVVSGATEDEINNLRNAVKPLIEKCGSEFGLTFDAVVEAAQSKTTDNLDPCFHACFFREVGIMNEEGLFTPEAGLEKKRQFIKDNEKSAEIEAGLKNCISVNEQAVSDGAKGCERAKLIQACIKDKIPFLPM